MGTTIFPEVSPFAVERVAWHDIRTLPDEAERRRLLRGLRLALFTMITDLGGDICGGVPLEGAVVDFAGKFQGEWVAGMQFFDTRFVDDPRQIEFDCIVASASTVGAGQHFDSHTDLVVPVMQHLLLQPIALVDGRTAVAPNIHLPTDSENGRWVWTAGFGGEAADIATRMAPHSQSTQKPREIAFRPNVVP